MPVLALICAILFGLWILVCLGICFFSASAGRENKRYHEQQAQRYPHCDAAYS